MTSNRNSHDSDARIEGKVAGLLTKRELLINRGRDDGVEIGMRFAILNQRGIDVKDPDTGKLLGSAEVAKTIVKIVRIDAEHLSTGRTFRKTPERAGPLASFAALSGTPSRVETLEIQGASLKEELDPKESYVKIGDVVVETKGDEYDDDWF